MSAQPAAELAQSNIGQRGDPVWPRRLPAECGGDLQGVLLMRCLADADAMAPHLVDGQVVFLPPGTFGSFTMDRIVRAQARRSSAEAA